MLGALILFFIVMILYMIIAEIFTVLFRLTGLPEEKAKLQVVSLLTTCGFTTKETEVFVTTPTRRKLCITAMIFGYAFSATLVSAFITFVLSFGNAQDENLWYSLLILIAVFILFIILSKIKFIKNGFDALIFKLGHKLAKNHTKNFIKVLDNYGANSIVELTIISLPENFKNKSLEESQIKQNYALTVLAITRGGKVINDVVKEEHLKEKDVVTIYGNLNTIKQIFVDDIENNASNNSTHNSVHNATNNTTHNTTTHNTTHNATHNTTTHATTHVTKHTETEKPKKASKKTN